MRASFSISSTNRSTKSVTSAGRGTVVASTPAVWPSQSCRQVSVSAASRQTVSPIDAQSIACSGPVQPHEQTARSTAVDIELIEGAIGEISALNRDERTGPTRTASTAERPERRAGCTKILRQDAARRDLRGPTASARTMSRSNTSFQAASGRRVPLRPG
ncbi:hypothetical protein [Streptomyces sp. NBC_01294]|uniref:hypothetical protein n=1 Tax=Streptomyces sp. NBC_01294 TaxID=2903815 RepID=UPI002DDC2DAB|nr:hypothetical protein [Streptomyces sp. NBC_01294]WRZ60564.1 hypothetical protein OG534_31215 [Streptomyces sp. NBC_01294]